MLTLKRIKRLVEDASPWAIVEEIAANGRPMAVSLRSRLEDADHVRIVALGLALQRATELSYAATPMIAGMLSQLLSELQQHKSSNKEQYTKSEATYTRTSVVVDAIVIRTLIAVREMQGGSIQTRLKQKLNETLGNALNRLSQKQSITGLIGDALDSTICLWQLRDVPVFQSLIRWQDLVEATMEHHHTSSPAPETHIHHTRSAA